MLRFWILQPMVFDGCRSFLRNLRWGRRTEEPAWHGCNPLIVFHRLSGERIKKNREQQHNPQSLRTSMLTRLDESNRAPFSALTLASACTPLLRTISTLRLFPLIPNGAYPAFSSSVGGNCHTAAAFPLSPELAFATCKSAERHRTRNCLTVGIQQAS